MLRIHLLETISRPVPALEFTLSRHFICRHYLMGRHFFCPSSFSAIVVELSPGGIGLNLLWTNTWMPLCCLIIWISSQLWNKLPQILWNPPLSKEYRRSDILEMALDSSNFVWYFTGWFRIAILDNDIFISKINTRWFFTSFTSVCLRRITNCFCLPAWLACAKWAVHS